MTNTRVTITFDVLDDSATWGMLARIIENNMPVSDRLRITEGLSATIAHEYSLGRFRMDATGPVL